jgi:hypothetical protein
MLFYKVAKDLDYENAEVVAAGHIYEMMISVFDDLHPSHTGNLDKIFKGSRCSFLRFFTLDFKMSKFIIFGTILLS